MKDINKRKRKEYNRKAYQKRKTKKAEEQEKPKTEGTKAPERRGDEKTKTDDTKTPERRGDEKINTDEHRGLLIKKSFTSNNKKYNFIDTEKPRPLKKINLILV